jgi:hypothetical protein
MELPEAILIGFIGIAAALINGLIMKEKGYSFGRTFLLTLIAICMLGMTISKLINIE